MSHLTMIKNAVRSAKGLTAAVGFAVVALTGTQSALAQELEKDTLKFGFIKLTDMAPLAIAKELGYFEEEGLEVELEAQANWKVLLNGVIDGQLDGAHMLSLIHI